jgi:predicted nucleic acid-binding Zn ribbon protein
MSYPYRKSKKCPVCGEKFEYLHDRKYCSTRCQNKGMSKKRK